jgi:DUF971 family protein
MLIYFALLALASAANIHDSRLRIVSPIQRINGHQTPVGLVQLLKSPVQSVYSPIDQVQYVRQGRQILNPLRLQYSVISVDPNTGHSVQVQYPNDQRVVLSQVQPHSQQLSFLSTQPSFERVISVGRVQPIDVQNRIILQSVQPLNEDDRSDKQIVTVVQPDTYGQSVQNLQIGTSVQPLQYSSIAQPVEYRDSVSALAQLSPSLQLQGKGGQHLSYFVRGSDVVNQEDLSRVYHPQVSTVEQQVGPLQYSSFSVLEPQVSQVVVQPSKHVSVQGLIQPRVRAIGYSDVNGNQRVQDSVLDSSYP